MIDKIKPFAQYGRELIANDDALLLKCFKAEKLEKMKGVILGSIDIQNSEDENSDTDGETY